MREKIEGEPYQFETIFPEIINLIVFNCLYYAINLGNKITEKMKQHVSYVEMFRD